MKSKSMHWTDMDAILSDQLEQAVGGDANMEGIDKIVRLARARTSTWTTKIRYASARNEKPEIAALN